MDFSTVLLNMASNSEAANNGGSMTIITIIFVVFMAAYMFMITRKDKKQQQSDRDMRENLKIGDEVLTIGGIMGRVVTVKEDSVVIETGADRNKIRFTKQAIARNVTEDAKAEAAKNAKIEAAKKAAEERKNKKSK